MIRTSENKVEKRFFVFSRNILFTGLTSFLTDTSVKMVYSVMPMFLLSIGASKTSLSLIEGIAESTAAISAFLMLIHSHSFKRDQENPGT